MFPRRRYLLADQVGAGGMGTVWRTWDRHERRWVAAKLARPDDATSLQRFARERALRVRHRHVVQPSGRAGDLFTMDLVRGGDLEQLLARHGPLPDSYVRVVLDQVLEALVAVHAAGLVHRDVKPGNLLLEPTGTGRPWVRLGDFGIAVASGEPPAHPSLRRRRHRRATCLPSRSPAPRPTRGRTCTPPAWSRPSC